MASSAQRPADTERRLTQDFAAWIDNEPVAVSGFYEHGLIVLDANVLLDLYRGTPGTRDNVIRTLRVVANANRLWVPHQAAIEFSRNRKKTVEDRTKAFKSAESSLKQARANAVEVLEKALGDLEKLRLRYETTREWDPAAAGLDHAGLTARLRGVMDPALEELAAYEAEFDLRPQDMQCVDPVLKQIDELFVAFGGGPLVGHALAGGDPPHRCGPLRKGAQPVDLGAHAGVVLPEAGLIGGPGL